MRVSRRVGSSDLEIRRCLPEPLNLFIYNNLECHIVSLLGMNNDTAAVWEVYEFGFSFSCS